MKKFLLTVFCLCVCAFVATADVNINSAFPDANFREYVTQYDSDGNGVLSQAELDAVTTISITQNQNISSLVGVKYFTNLQYLYIRRNNLTTLDVSGMSKLEELICDQNQLTSIDMNGLTSLTMLYCSNNNLQTLDLTVLPNLESVHCNSNNLTSL